VFTGFYTGVNLARHYAAGDIYLHASTTETFGNVITEALGSGLAVSAFDEAAAHEFIQPETGGLLAPVGDEAAFLANAVRLGRDPALRRRLAAIAPVVVSDMSWDTIIDRFAADLVSAMAEHHASPANPTSRIQNPELASPTRP